MAVAVATEAEGAVHGVAIIGGEIARALRSAPRPIRAGELLGHSGEFQAGDFVYVATRGRDGGQSVLGIGTAAIDASALAGAAREAVVVDALALLWDSAQPGAGDGGGD